MSRSRRHVPIMGTCVCRSERADKVSWHRRFRARVREAIQRSEEVMPHIRDVSDVWSFGKDGKRYWRQDHRGTFWNERPWKLWGK